MFGKKNDYPYAKRNPLFTVTFRNYDNLGAMQRTLAWQWTLKHVDYDKVCDILQEEDTYVIPDDLESRVMAIPQLVYNGKTYDPDNDSKVVDREGQSKGYYLTCLLGGVRAIPNPDKAADFVTRLSQVEELWAMVQDGKDLPEEAPPLVTKKKSKAKKPESEQKSGESKTEADKQEQQETTEEATQSQVTIAISSPLYDHWGKLDGDGVADELRKMSYPDAVEFTNRLRGERSDFKEKMEKSEKTYVGGLIYYMNAVISFYPELPAAVEFLGELKKELAEKQLKEQQPDGESSGKKENSDDDTKLKNYINRRKKKVRDWIKQAEAADDDFLLDILDDMKIALDKSDVDRYEKLEKRYNRIMSAGQQTNPKKDSSTNSTGSDDQDGGTQTTEESESEGEDSEDNTSEEETTEDSEDSASEEETSSDDTSRKKSDPNSGKTYPIKDVITWMKMIGLGEEKFPSTFTMSADQTKTVTAIWVNEYMESIGNDNRLAQ